MKFPVTAAVVFGCVLAQPSQAQTNCSEAFAACQKPQDNLRCDPVCKAYCVKEKKACLKNGSFRTKTQQFSGLEKK